MVWTLGDYPSSMKNINPVIRKKAIDIGNSMIDEGYKEGDAIPIAISQAKEWHENTTNKEIEHYRKHGKVTTRSPEGQRKSSSPERMEEGEIVRSHDDGWSVSAENAENPSDVFPSKDEAIKRANEIAKNKGTSVTIYKKDGTIQDKYAYDEK